MERLFQSLSRSNSVESETGSASARGGRKAATSASSVEDVRSVTPTKSILSGLFGRMRSSSSAGQTTTKRSAEDFLIPPEDLEDVCLPVERMSHEETMNYLARYSHHSGMYGKRGSPEIMRIMLDLDIGAENRGELWLGLSGAKEKMLGKIQGNNMGYFDKLVRLQSDDGPDIRQIEVDLHRTFLLKTAGQDAHEHEAESHVDVDKLKRVLIAASVELADMGGYCQSMNFLAAFLLEHLDEEESFWLLVCIARELLPNYYTPSLLGCRVDQRVLEMIVKRRFPDIADHILSVGLPRIGLLVYHWLLTLFVNVLKRDTVIKFWDAFFSRGATLLFEVTLQILQDASARFSDDDDIEAVSAAMNAAMKNATPDTIELAMRNHGLPAKWLRALRKQCLAEIQREDEESTQRFKAPHAPPPEVPSRIVPPKTSTKMKKMKKKDTLDIQNMNDKHDSQSMKNKRVHDEATNEEVRIRSQTVSECIALCMEALRNRNIPNQALASSRALCVTNKSTFTTIWKQFSWEIFEKIGFRDPEEVFRTFSFTLEQARPTSSKPAPDGAKKRKMRRTRSNMNVIETKLIDFREVLSALVVLCAGQREEKLRLCL